MEKLKIAFNYGADAVYLSDNSFGLRAAADNFSVEEIAEAVMYAHERKGRVYVAVNIIPRNEDLIDLPGYLKKLNNIKPDGIILSDPGVLAVAGEVTENIPLILSTQANVTNYKSALFWKKQGVSKVILARELSIDEVKDIIDNAPRSLEFEVFVHGSMCISYSGRCLLSSYMTGRDANRGDCTQSCRWSYNLMEEKRPGKYFPVYEDERGTYIFSSKDLCLIRRLPELIQAGVKGFKIEGRMKSSLYVASTVSVYRKAIDEYLKNPKKFEVKPEWIEELNKVKHRGYTEAFFESHPSVESQVYNGENYKTEYNFAGIVIDYDPDSGFAVVEQRNKFNVGDEIEIIGPSRECLVQVVREMTDEEGNAVESAPHARQIVKLKVENPVKPLDIIRKKAAG